MTKEPDVFIARPAERPLRGTVRVPGDKSISHRAVLVSLLAPGRSVVSGINLGNDVRATCRVVEQIGGGVRLRPEAAEVEIDGCGWDGLREPVGELDAGNSATTMRLALGVCSGLPGTATLTGDASLLRRPMLRVVRPLRAMGATIDGPHGGARGPLTVRGGELQGISWVGEVASAQVKSAILLAALRARGTTSYTEPAPTRDHTERMLTSSGVTLRRYGCTVEVEGGQSIQPRRRRVPGDLSAATFVATAAAIVPGSDVRIEEVGLNPTRTAAIGVLSRMGADITTSVEGEDAGEPYGEMRVRGGSLRATTIRAEEVPGLIDELPALAVAASQATGTTVVRGARELRAKESDRIETIVDGLRSAGADASSFDDGFSISGPRRLRSGRVPSHGDHRIALALAAGGLAADGPLEIDEWSSAAISFPGWEETMATLRDDG